MTPSMRTGERVWKETTVTGRLITGERERKRGSAKRRLNVMHSPQNNPERMARPQSRHGSGHSAILLPQRRTDYTH